MARMRVCVVTLLFVPVHYLCGHSRGSALRQTARDCARLRNSETARGPFVAKGLENGTRSRASGRGKSLRATTSRWMLSILAADWNLQIARRTPPGRAFIELTQNQSDKTRASAAAASGQIRLSASKRASGRASRSRAVLISGARGISGVDAKELVDDDTTNSSALPPPDNVRPPPPPPPWDKRQGVHTQVRLFTEASPPRFANREALALCVSARATSTHTQIRESAHPRERSRPTTRAPVRVHLNHAVRDIQLRRRESREKQEQSSDSTVRLLKD
ncbi:Hypothetical predicted protein [Olea europaea subsp. europaea]|uniref:Secreted protein n=1 Tax=Olea europaea subsp. europaea TaxID=158383 RepID=A0A8S0Q437_OLEEU|nr:Hypothetical predicted protein [Olea europaea subsp. europaea]